jgi:hypothetical protein
MEGSLKTCVTYLMCMHTGNLSKVLCMQKITLGFNFLLMKNIKIKERKVFYL